MKPEEVLTASLDDLVFERKNKAYGAYYLRQVYQKHITRALIISLIIFLLGFCMPTIISLFQPKEVPMAKPKITTTTLAPPPPIEPNTPPPPPPPKIPPPPPQVKLTPPVIKSDEEVKQENVPPPVEQIQNAPPSNAPAFDPNAKVDFNDAPATVEAAPQSKIWLSVEQEPEFPGGFDALTQYLSKNINYPNAARESGIEGKVILQFVVNETGQVSDIKVLRDLGGGCTDEAIRVVKGMPKWKPGKQNGHEVKVQMVLPVLFKLGSN